MDPKVPLGALGGPHCLTVRDYKRCIIVSEVIYAGLLCAIGLLQVSTDIYLILG